MGEPRTGRRIHLDVMPTNGSRDDEVERLKGLDATEYEDHRKPDGTGWVTMADPEGNLFCVERSATERV
ncbi:VOC family protein [Micromonospora polyrhachis]|nr:VOC family protein [Micromonospora polyrhachis]